MEPRGSFSSHSPSLSVQRHYESQPWDDHSQSKAIVMLFQRLLGEQRQEIIKLQHRVDHLSKTSVEELQQQLQTLQDQAYRGLARNSL